MNTNLKIRFTIIPLILLLLCLSTTSSSAEDLAQTRETSERISVRSNGSYVGYFSLRSSISLTASSTSSYQTTTPKSPEREVDSVQLIDPSDIAWDDRFYHSGFYDGFGTGSIASIAVSENEIYAGGFFTKTGIVEASNIAVWDGTRWSALGSGVNNWVNAIALDGENVYVGGSFTEAGGNSSIQHVAKWDGTSGWEALGLGVNGTVEAIAIQGDDIYVGGSFTTAGTITATNIAKWNIATGWVALGEGVNGTVRAIAVNGSDLYVGGTFSMSGATPTSNIAKWNNGSWIALDTGVNDTVYALDVLNDDLYVGGNFTQAGGNSIQYIAKWDGNIWSSLGSGIEVPVFCIANNNNEVFVGGMLWDMFRITRISKWDGSTWEQIGGDEVLWVPMTMAFIGNDLYVGGQDPNIDAIKKWNGSNWSIVDNGQGLYQGVNYVIPNGDDIYVGSQKWDGKQWIALPFNNGVSSFEAMAQYNGELYGNGTFTPEGGSPTRCIIKWDNITWTVLGCGLSMDRYAVMVMTVVNGEIYVGGQFNSVDNILANNIAKWSGGVWSALGNGVNYPVYALAFEGEILHVGGAFTSPAMFHATWDGSSWSQAGGAPNIVYALAIEGSNVYVGMLYEDGYGPSLFKCVGDICAPFGGGVNGSVKTIVVTGSDVYIGGSFTQTGSVAANRIAKWDGVNWSALGSGLSFGTPNSIAVIAHDVYVGGGFTQAGSKPSYYFAHWNPYFAISGQVMDSNGLPIDGVTISATSEISVSTDINGSYEFIDLISGTYTITPTLYGLLFSPITRTLSVPPNASGQDFTFNGVHGSVISTTISTLVYTDTQGNPTSIHIPAGAVTETITLFFTPVPTIIEPSDFSFAGHAFDLEAYRGDIHLLGFTFEQPVTAILNYTDSEVAGLDESALTLRYYDGSAWFEAACGLYIRNLEENWVQVPICHLSRFALFGIEIGNYRINLPLVKQ